MTAAQVAMVVREVRAARQHEYAPDADKDHDRYGCDKRGDSFDARHTEDVFPY